MAKQKTVYYCQSCGAQSAKWIGKCPSCSEWNTYVEEIIIKEVDQKAWQNVDPNKRANNAKPITQVSYNKQQRFPSGNTELDRVLGGGIVAGSLVLIGGEPGIGKSTLMLQIALGVNNKKVLYVSGEESEEQIKMRANRIELEKKDSCFLLAETSLVSIFQQAGRLKPDIVIIDSIQTLHSDRVESGSGSISQVKDCTGQLIQYAKESGTPVFLIGHITKDGALAGPKVLEHMVDTVLQFEGDRHHSYRILRTTKNRFGSTSELGIYEMSGSGLREVSNPSEILISQKEDDLSGATIGATMEGNRPLLIEIQALVSPATYGTPQRSTTGFDSKRLNMLLAVLEKRGGLRLSTQDVFLNIAGGIRVDDPAMDLAICVAVFSSFRETGISSKTCFAAEIGLGGEVRAVNHIDRRISEAEKLGFEEMFVSKFNLKGVNATKRKITIKGATRISDVFGDLFG